MAQSSSFPQRRKHWLKRKRVLLPLIGVTSLAIVAWLYAAPILRAGSGYAAKNICSGHFLSGFDGELMVQEALIGASPLLANVSFEIDRDGGSVNTRLYGLFPRTAKYRTGLGCTLLSENGQNSVGEIEARSAGADQPGQPWPLGNLADHQVSKINAVLDRAFAEDDKSEPKNTKAIVAIHDGRLVAERYADGVEADTPLIGWSMTKSITNMLIGILVGDGLLNVSKPAMVPQWRTNPNDRRADITVDDLLRMSSGLVFDEEYSLYSDVTRMLSNEADMAHFAASFPIDDAEDAPEWLYSSGTTNILAGIFRQIVGPESQPVYDFVQERLFRPIGIRTGTLELDASGTPIGSSYMYGSAREWARLGQLALQDGRWAGQQILPEGWMAYSTTPAPKNPSNVYGAHFWLNLEPTDSKQTRVFPLLPTDTFAMDGYQGQYVVVIPSQRLVVVRLGFTPGTNHGVEQLVANISATLNE